MTDQELAASLDSYLETAIWASGEEYDEYSIHDFSRESREFAKETLGGFVERHEDLIERLLDENLQTPNTIGHNLWLTTEGHGAGFWDAGLGRDGDTLTEDCRTHRSDGIYLGDDGRLHLV